MPKPLSSFLGINQSELTSRDVFDPILDMDTLLGIDPHLLKHTEVNEFLNSYEAFQKHFMTICKLLMNCERAGDIFWNRADSMMNWREVRGLCIGHSHKGTSGSGIGPKLRKQILTTAKILIDKGKNDPELFELVGLFQKDIGPDRISDMTANIIRKDLESFTLRVLGEIDQTASNNLSYDKETNQPLNPMNDEPLLLVPRSLLRDIPLALDWSQRDVVALHNADLRNEVNSVVGESWKQAVADHKKEDLRDKIIEFPDLLDDLIRQYTAKHPHPYNFLEDRAGEVCWLPAAFEFTRQHPLALTLPTHPTIDEVYAFVLEICEKFTELVEQNSLYELFYNDDGSVKHEKAAQLVFYGIAEVYCERNRIMIARESDAGRGPIDFKFGTNMQNSVLVELKKSTNTSGLKNGIINQLPIYMNSEKSRRAIYLVLDVGHTEAAEDNLKEINAAINGTSISIMHVDANPKPSASRAKTRK